MDTKEQHAIKSDHLKTIQGELAMYANAIDRTIQKVMEKAKEKGISINADKARELVEAEFDEAAFELIWKVINTVSFIRYCMSCESAAAAIDKFVDGLDSVGLISKTASLNLKTKNRELSEAGGKIVLTAKEVMKVFNLPKRAVYNKSFVGRIKFGQSQQSGVRYNRAKVLFNTVLNGGKLAESKEAA